MCLARDAIFGQEEMARCSLSGKKSTRSLNEKKLEDCGKLPDSPKVASRI